MLRHCDLDRVAKYCIGRQPAVGKELLCLSNERLIDNRVETRGSEVQVKKLHHCLEILGRCTSAQAFGCFANRRTNTGYHTSELLAEVDGAEVSESAEPDDLGCECRGDVARVRRERCAA